MSSSLNILALFCIFQCVPALPAATTTFYVSPSGEDGQPGTADRPFATPGRARQAVTEAQHRPGAAMDAITVNIAEGTYYLSAPLAFTARDTTCPVSWIGQAGGTVRFSGGREVTGFKPVTDPAVRKRLDAAVRDKVVWADLKKCGIKDLGHAVARGKRPELFFNDQPMQLARWPNAGFVTIQDVAGKTAFTVHGRRGTREGKLVYGGKRPERWLDEKDIFLHGYWFWDWSDSFEKVAAIDTAKKIIATAPPYHNYGFRKGQRFYAINLLCELDAPGEWYLDRESRRLYFYPPAPLSAGKVVLSVLPHLVSGRDSRRLAFKSLILEAVRNTAVNLENPLQCRVENCIIRNTGSWGVRMAGGKGSIVSGCDIHQVGEGGIALNGGDRKRLIPCGHAALHNHIHHFGRLYRTYRPAIGMGGVGIRAEHNLIHNGPHNAIQLGGNDHRIRYNEIHHVCFETGDVGAFYMGRDWTARGTVIEGNYFHHIQGPGLHGAMAVYLDDAASGITIRQNIFYKAGRAAFIGGGRDNRVEHNIFVDCPASVHVDARGVGWMKYHVEGNGTLPTRLKAMPYKSSPWRERYPELLTILDDDPGLPKGNIVRMNISFGGKWLNVEKKALPLIRFEDNLVDQDPRFVDLKNLDFRLKPDSPALKMGIKPPAVEKIGPQKAHRAWLPKVPSGAHKQ